MNMNDLGPLESAALRALAQAELIDAPLTVASLWRSLPGYTTSLPNLRAALADGAPLRNYVARDKDCFALQGRDDLLQSMGARQGASDARWRELKDVLRGLGKLPWVEAVGITGTMAWGLLDEERLPCELVIIAEGGRAPLARASVRVWRKAARLTTKVRIAAVLDADHLAVPATGPTAAWWLLAVRPVVNAAAFQRLWAANQWAGTLFPNFDVDSTGGQPQYFLGERVDGKLAAVRRAAVTSADDGVLLGAAGRKDAAWESALLGVVEGMRIAQPCREWGVGAETDVLVGTSLVDGDARLAGRMRELASWTFEDATPPEPEESDVEPQTAEPVAAASKAVPGSKRQRGPTRQRASKKRTPRARSSAAPEGSSRG